MLRRRPPTTSIIRQREMPRPTISRGEIALTANPPPRPVTHNKPSISNAFPRTDVNVILPTRHRLGPP